MTNGGHTLAEFVFLLAALPGGYTLHYVFRSLFIFFRLFVWKLVCSNEITLLIVCFRNNLFRKKYVFGIASGNRLVYHYDCV